MKNTEKNTERLMIINTKNLVRKQKNKAGRIRLITSWIENNQKWKNTIFSDEK